MKSLLWRASLRHLLRHPWQLVLAVLGVALGVAVVVGIDVANGSAQRAFELSSETIAGKATHQIVGPGRGAGGRPLSRRSGSISAFDWLHPWSRVTSASSERAREVLLLLGIDPLAEAPFRELRVAAGPRSKRRSRRLPHPPRRRAAGVGDGAERFGLAVGDRFDVDIGGAVRALELVGFLESESGQSAALQDLVVVDIATAQETLGTVRRSRASI